jgi:circadian clock protein KaiC
VHQAISVFKKRTGGHERSIRQLKIESDGIHIGEPLHQFRGIMTGVPQYYGSTDTGGDPPEPRAR